ncbi:alpha/beta fold hydrolase [Hoeflea olei]|uniref:AB hydrolase-1 domain-containing protein n=1 Tax=Hoeflea olei TaxID=1480615 RepID=A0A1C1Z0C4_9HYPH|nr:alpha/beta fold hydrolase [Hoeflea olei]OCW59157.1 hypothetical protein AWJ14_08810 [Hoeflea olei]
MGLHMEISGPETGATLVLLHGFGGDGSAWDQVRAALPKELRVITVDLPGHGGSLEAEGRGGAGRMAKAILAGLDAAGIDRFHVAGHSMGGAVAALIAMRAGERVASLTLVAPGGMAREINAGLLARYAKAQTADEIRACLSDMSAPGHSVPESVVEHFVALRARPGALEALDETYRAMFPDGPEAGQGVLPAAQLAALTMPVTVLWGTEDKVLPCPAPDALPPSFAMNVLPGLGHMVPEEAPEAVARVLAHAVAG